MKQERILDALNGVDTAYLLDAAPTNQRSARRPLAAILSVAACLVLAAVGTVLLLGSRLPRPAAPDASAQPSENTCALPGIPEGPTDADPADENGAKSEPGAEEPREDIAGSVDRETILRYRVGGLSLGMPQAELETLLGPPDDTSNSGPVTFENGITHVSWFYNLSGDPTRHYDLSVDLADAGDGWVINALDVWSGIPLALPHGVRIGITESELLEVWPELAAEFHVEEEPYEPDTRQTQCKSYRQSAADCGLYLIISLERFEEYRVTSLSLGRYYPDPPFDETPPAEPYSFASSEITVWKMENGVWRSVELSGQDAKQVEVLFGIESLGELSCGTGVAEYYVDFHNGTVVGVFDESEAGFVYRLDDPEAFQYGLQAGSFDPDVLGLSRLRGAVFPAGVWALLGEVCS